MKRKFTILTAAFMLLTFLAVPLGMRGQTTWEKATSIQAGDVVVIVTEFTSNYELSGISSTSTKYGVGTSYESLPEGTFSLTVVTGNSAETFAFKTTDNKYLYWGSGNSLNVNSNLSDNTSWKVTFNGTDATILNAKDENRQLFWNNSSPRFACYTGQSVGNTYKSTSFYKQVNSGGSQTVATPTFSPNGGSFPNSQNVTISCATDGAAIHYSVIPDPYEWHDYPNGGLTFTETTTVYAYATKSGMTDSQVNSATFTKVTPLANIAALTANSTNATYFVTLDDAVVTFVNGSNAYIQDASGAVAMHKNDHGLTAGDVLNGTATVAYQLYNGNPQITNLTGVTSVSGTAPEPSEVAQSAWSYTFSDVLSQYFKVMGATITQNNSKYYVSLGGESIQLYKSGGSISSLDLTKTYSIIGFPTLYVNNNTTTKELTIYADPEVEIGTAPVINANNVSIDYNATSGAIEYTIDNPGTGITLGATCDADWVSNIVVGASSVTFTTTANEGNTDRTATFTLTYTGAQDKTVTVTQGHYVVDYAVLPFSWEGGTSSELTALAGVTGNSLGDYAVGNSPYLVQFNATGDYIQVKTDSQPDIVTIGVKMIGGSNTSTITVQGSADGQTFTDIETLTISGKQNDVLTLTSTQSFDADIRYIRLYFTKGSNVGVGPISITKYVAPENHNLTVTLGEHVEAIFVFNAADNTEALIEDGAPGTVSVLSGTSIEVSPMAASGYVISSLIVNNEDVTSQMDVSGAYTFTMPASDVTITATAVEEPYTISFFVNGIEFVTAEMEVTPGQTIGTLPIPADNIPEGFTFFGWMEWPDHPYYNATTAPPTMVTAATVPSDDMILDAVFCIGETAQGTWTLSNSVPAAGDQIILAVEDGGNYYAMFASEDALTSTSFTVSSNVITGTVPSSWAVEDGSYTANNNDYTGLGLFSGQYKEVQGDQKKMYLHLNASVGKIATGFQNGVFEFGDNNILHGKVNGKYLKFESTAFGVSSNEAEACPLLIFKYTPGPTTNKDYTTSVVYHANNTTIAETAAEILYGIHYINGYVLAGNEVTNNGKLVINENGLLDMYGHDLNNNTAANLIIKDGAQLYTPNAVYGTIQKNITGYGDNDGGYYLVTAPATTVIGSNFYTTLNGDVDIYLFDQNEENFEWRNFKQATSAWNIGPACAMLYANKNDITLSFNGDWTNYVNSNPVEQNAQLPATNADINVPLEYTANKNFSGVNLIGNPFPCNATVNCSFYKMNDAGSALVPATDGEVIAPCTGIIVEATGMSQNATFSMSTSTATVMRGTLNMNLTNQQNKVDKAIVSFNEGSELGKISLLESNATISFSMDGKDYAVVSSDATGELPLNFKASRNGEYTLSFDTENVEMGYLHLIDNLTGTDVDLLANPSYTFEGKKSDYASRFRLLFKATSINDIDTEMNDDFAFISDGNVIILNEGEATLQVIDIMGRVISTQTVNGNASVNSVGAAGVYVLQLINGNNVKTQKIVVR